MSYLTSSFDLSRSQKKSVHSILQTEPEVSYATFSPQRQSVAKSFYETKRTNEPKKKEEEEELRFDINKRLANLKKQLGLIGEKSEDEKKLEKLDKLDMVSRKIDKSLEKNPSMILEKSRQEFESRSGVRQQEPQSGTSARRSMSFEKPKKLDLLSESREEPVKLEKPRELVKEVISKEEHKTKMEGELRKLENRFFGLFEMERKENQEKIEQEKEQIERDFKKKYEDEMLKLELKGRTNETLIVENEKLKRELFEFKQKDRTAKEEVVNVRKLLDSEESRARGNNSSIEREKMLMQKIEDLEEQRRKLINDIQEYKDDLRTLKEDIRKDEEIYEKCLEKLKKYKAKNMTLTERIIELEAENQHYKDTEEEKAAQKATKKKAKAVKTADEGNPLKKKGSLPKNETLNTSASHEKDLKIKELGEEVHILHARIRELEQKNMELVTRKYDFEGGESSGMESPTERGKSNDKETNFWKSKCETLVKKYINALRHMREENENLKRGLLDEVDQLKVDATTDLKNIKKMFKNKMSQLEGPKEIPDKTTKPKTTTAKTTTKTSTVKR